MTRPGASPSSRLADARDRLATPWQVGMTSRLRRCSQSMEFRRRRMRPWVVCWREPATGRSTIDSWESEEELHEKISEFLATDPELAITPGDSDALKRSIGATGTYKEWASFEFGDGAAGAERWQMLTPVRSRPGGVVGLNQLVRRNWRKGDASQAIRSWRIPPPLGGDEILFHDKVMCIRNHQRDGQTESRETVKADVANGEIGVAVGWWKRKCIRVEFSTQGRAPIHVLDR